MLIGEVAKIVNTSIDTIRYYERKGLIKPIFVRNSGYREFDKTSINLIKFILNAKKIGFSLKEIKYLILLKEKPNTNCHNIRSMADEKLNEIKVKIKALKHIEKDLIKLIKECDNVNNKECPIIENLNKGDKK